jgi:ABC-type cobalamin transport system permease subunit
LTCAKTRTPIVARATSNSANCLDEEPLALKSPSPLEVNMNRTIHPVTRLATLATIVMALVLVTAGRAAAMRPDPAPADPGGAYDGPSRASVVLVPDNSVSILQWVLFVAAVTGALLIGAGLMHLAQRRRTQLAH